MPALSVAAPQALSRLCLSLCLLSLFPSRISWICDEGYDVFLSFRGSDTRTSFVDHLDKGLKAANIKVFKDDCNLPPGKQIGPELSYAINNSKIAIPIISKGYAESEWCLTELAHIMDCHRRQGKVVLPIFYDVDVSDVHNQTGEFGEGFSKLAKHCKPEEVRKWREELRSLTRIKGWTSRDVADGYEGELVNLVVEKTRSELWRLEIERFLYFPFLNLTEFWPPFNSLIENAWNKRREWQVFLTFSPATEKSFAACLRYCLERENISVFSPDDQSLIGKDYAHENRNAIDHCKIFIPILSKDFASSSHCLDNLTQMVECKSNGQTILPIFYKVKPSKVREVSNCFLLAMLHHKALRGEDTYERWQTALCQVGSLAGLVSEDIDHGDEGSLLKEVIKVVLALLKNPKA